MNLSKNDFIILTLYVYIIINGAQNVKTNKTCISKIKNAFGDHESALGCVNYIIDCGGKHFNPNNNEKRCLNCTKRNEIFNSISGTYVYDYKTHIFNSLDFESYGKYPNTFCGEKANELAQKHKSLYSPEKKKLSDKVFISEQVHIYNDRRKNECIAHLHTIFNYNAEDTEMESNEFFKKIFNTVYTNDIVEDYYADWFLKYFRVQKNSSLIKNVMSVKQFCEDKN